MYRYSMSVKGRTTKQSRAGDRQETEYVGVSPLTLVQIRELAVENRVDDFVISNGRIGIAVLTSSGLAFTRGLAILPVFPLVLLFLGHPDRTQLIPLGSRPPGLTVVHGLISIKRLVS